MLNDCKSKVNQKLSNNLEKKCREITGGNWKEKISGPNNPAIAATFEKWSQSSGKNTPKKDDAATKERSDVKGETKKESKKKKSVPPVMGLIRQIRNWVN